MEQKKKVSEAEWKVLDILWDNPGMHIGEIRAALADSGWSYSTIKTLVLRLTQKGAVRATAGDRGKRYYPAADRDTLQLMETKSFVDRIYHGSVRMMFSNLVKDSKLTEKETDELLSLIDKIED